MNNELLEIIKYNLDGLIENERLSEKYICVFGMNHPGDFIIKYLGEKGISVNAVIDNSPANNGLVLEGVAVSSPEEALSVFKDNASVLICSRYYAEMRRQLERMGYVSGVHIFKILDMENGAVFSLDKSVFTEKAEKALKGAELAERILTELNAETLFVCPVKANGDVYIACSLLRAYAAKNRIEKYALVLIGNACANVAKLFGFNNIYMASQADIESLTSAYRLLSHNGGINVLQPYWNYSSFINRLDCFKGLNFFDYYKHWVFGLDEDVTAEKPKAAQNEERFAGLFERHGLLKGKTVILSPYANSLSGVPTELFERLAKELKNRGYHAATNVAGDEAPIAGTVALSFPICDLISVAEYAGAFVGIRNGLCDILSSASCVKAIIYPQKSYAFGTVLELYSISDICENPVLELIYDGEIQKCVLEITNYILESETV